MNNNVKRALIIPLAASFIAGSTLLLNLSIAQAQGIENSKVVTDTSAATTGTSTTATSTTGTATTTVSGQSTAATNISGTTVAQSSGLTATTATIVTGTHQANVPDFTIENSGWNKDRPSDKDLSMNDAAMLCAKALRYYNNVNTANGNMLMTFLKNSYNFRIARDMWDCSFTAADGTEYGDVSIDSVTGQVYNVIIFPAVSNPDSDKWLLTEEFDNSVINDKRYSEAVCDYIKEKMPDKTIASAKNTTDGSISAGSANGDCIIETIVSVDVKLTDGTRYEVEIGYKSLKIYSFHLSQDGT